MKKAILWSVVSLLFIADLSAQTDLTKLLPRDPEVVVGKLPNGLTYYLRHNETPKERADFLLLRNVGSLAEKDEECGLAHFLEHMTFQGTEHFPGHAITAFLERNGVMYGHDINALTNENETVYSLTGVPTTDPRFLDTCALVLHDWLHCLTLDGAAIDNERGVITEEWNMRNTPDNRMMQQMTNVILKDSRYVGREVIGTLDVIQHFPHQAIYGHENETYNCVKRA